MTSFSPNHQSHEGNIVVIDRQTTSPCLIKIFAPSGAFLNQYDIGFEHEGAPQQFYFDNRGDMYFVMHTNSEYLVIKYKYGRFDRREWVVRRELGEWLPRNMALDKVNNDIYVTFTTYDDPLQIMTVKYDLNGRPVKNGSIQSDVGNSHFFVFDNYGNCYGMEAGKVVKYRPPLKLKKPPLAPYMKMPPRAIPR